MKMNLLKISIIAFIIIPFNLLFAQQNDTKNINTIESDEEGIKINLDTWSVSASYGSMLFYGDVKQFNLYPLSNNNVQSWYDIYNADITERRWAGSFTLNKQINDNFGVRGQMLIGKLSGVNRRDKNNGEYFNANIFENNVSAIVSLDKLLYKNKKNEDFNLYALVGIGFVQFRTYRRELGTDKFLRDFGYDEDGKTKIRVTTETVIPVGLGFKYKINEKIDFNFETSLRLPDTDKLDAKIKGNRDNYTYTSIGIIYKLGKRKSRKDKITGINYIIKKTKAHSRYKKQDYNGAFRIYRKLYKYRYDDAKLNYKMGLCSFKEQELEDAIPYFEKARVISPNVNKKLPFFLGQTYQSLENIDGAIDNYNEYKLKLSNAQIKRSGINKLWFQCLVSKNLMENPVNVTITNLGDSVNTEFDEGLPYMNSDSKSLIFTSRRGKNVKGIIIGPSSELLDDDIYISKWNKKENTWDYGIPILGRFNSDGHDAFLSLAKDSSMLLIYKNIPGETESGDIYYSIIKENGEWSKPKSIGEPINSTYFESSACLSPDGNTIYFISERKGGVGNADIYKSHRIPKDEEGRCWSEPENLGPVINTENDELGIFMSNDGKTLFFSSKGHNSMGGYDMFMSKYENEKWSQPVNLGYPINTSRDELHFFLTDDGKKAYVSSRRKGGMGGADIYEIDMTNYLPPLPITRDSLYKLSMEK